MWKRIIKWFHVHAIHKIVASRYVSFNYRDVIYECKCGHRWKEKGKRAEYILPHVETCDTWQQKKFDEYLINGKYHINSESHNKLWEK